MMDLIKIAECLSSVAAVALTPFVIMLQRNISSENWFVSKKKMMWATSPFALISFSLGAYITYLVNKEMEPTASAPIQQPNMKFVEADAVLCVRFTLLCAYMTFLMSLVNLKTGWSSGLRKKIPLSKPLFFSLLAINLLFLQALLNWICNVAPRDSGFLTMAAFFCMFLSWFLASVDMVTELELLELTELGNELDFIDEELGKRERNIEDANNLEDTKKRLALARCVLSKYLTDSRSNQRSPVVEPGEQV